MLQPILFTLNRLRPAGGLPLFMRGRLPLPVIAPPRITRRPAQGISSSLHAQASKIARLRTEVDSLL